MTANLALAFVGPLAMLATPVGARLLVNALRSRDVDGLTVAAAILALSWAVTWSVSVLDSNIGGILKEQIQPFVNTRLAGIVNRCPTIDRLEDPDYLRDLDNVKLRGGELTNGPLVAALIVRLVVRTIGMIGLLATVDGRVAFFPLLGLAPVFAGIYAERGREHDDEDLAEERRLVSDLFSCTTDGPNGKEIRISGMGDELVRRHAAAAVAIETAESRTAFQALVVETAGWVMFALGFLATIVIAYDGARSHPGKAADIIVVFVLAQLVGTQVTEATDLIKRLMGSVRAFTQLDRLESASRQAVERHALPPERLEHGIDLRSVSFAYPGGRVALSDVSAFIPAGSVVVVVGENGAGKTTLVKLLAGLYEPASGEIAIDGVPMSTLDPRRWAQRVSASFQDFIRFELIAQHAIGIGDLPRHDDAAAVGQAVARARTSSLIDEWPEGLSTQLGPSFAGGSDLSGGQWQQIAVSRGMMRDKPLLLLLDEPLASLDAEREHALLRTYADESQRTAATSGAITLFVSHRFSTALLADLVLVLHEGRLVESGTHDELIARGATYSELFSLQARDYQINSLDDGDSGG